MQKEISLFDRTLLRFRSAWQGLNRGDGDIVALKLRPNLPEADVHLLRQQMQECLQGTGGEVSARSRAAGLGHSYLRLNDIGKQRFLSILADDFGPDTDALVAATRALQDAADTSEQTAAESRLRDLATPPRMRLLTRFNALPQGVRFLVDLRADLRRYLPEHAELINLDNDLKSLLRSWFDVGFLDLQRITWDHPASLLERLITYEAVHEIRSWQDLHNRLQSDRRIYAFFHPRMPQEPLIFVQVALVREITNSVQTLLDEEAPLLEQSEATTAVFYSISNTQKGLQGVSFGDFLIKRVVQLLRRDLPGLKTFVTLSPVPGLRRYLESLPAATRDELIGESDLSRISKAGNGDDLPAILAAPNWHHGEALAAVLKEPMKRLCAHYLLTEKRQQRALDPVANFHLDNGARLEQINWLADTSKNGLRKSAGLMVNYLYKLADIEKNHERYRGSGEVAATAAVRNLLK